MRHQKDSEFAERRKTSIDAKAKRLADLKGALDPNDPARVAARAEKIAAAAGRNAIREENARLKRQSEQAVAAAAIKADRDAKAEVERRQEAEAAKGSGEAQQKAERDRRYAARKARQR